MKIDEFKGKFEALQKEGNEIYAQIKPLLKRLKSLSKKCVALASKADLDGDDLYETFTCKVDYGDILKEEVRSRTKGWDISILRRLRDFDYLLDDDQSPLEGLDNVLYNLMDGRFKLRRSRRSRS